MQRELQEAVSKRNELAQSLKDLEKKWKISEGDLAKVIEELGQSEKLRKIAVAERDELHNEFQALSVSK